MFLAQTLIDKAIKTCGSAAELARRLEIYPADVTNLKKGKRPLSPEIAAEIAEIAGMDARQAAIDAIIERNAANRKGALLADILGKGQAVGAAAMLGISYNGDSITDTAVIKTAAKNIAPKLTKYTSYLTVFFGKFRGLWANSCFARTGLWPCGLSLRPA